MNMQSHGQARGCLSLAALALTGLCAAVTGCAPALPAGPVERTLVLDVSKVVDLKARTGWLVDEKEIEATLPDALKSVCQVPERNRRASLAWLDREIALRGGDVAAVWRNEGRNLDHVDNLLLLTRVRLLLSRADEWARLGRCPFWLEPSTRFRGVHFQAERLIVAVEGGGRFIGTSQKPRTGGTEISYGAGGSGRLMVGWGLDSEWAVLLGAEAGGDATFSDLSLGEQDQLPSLSGFVAMPVVARWDFGLSTYAAFEAGPLLSTVAKKEVDLTSGITAISKNLTWGLRTGATIGGSFLRLQQGFLSRFALAVTFDVVPSINALQLGVGLRTGVDFSSWKDF